jgi:hypothetical protein
MRLDLDTTVYCVDGRVGELVDVLVQPSTCRLTHLVIQPHSPHDHERLVSVTEAHAREGSDGISLESTVAQISQLESIRNFAYLRRGEFPAGDADWDIGIQEITALPEYGSLGPEALGAGVPTLDYDQHVAVSYHVVPKGHVEIRRSSAVTSSDGHHLGHVVGFVIDDQQQIGHLVLEHGHLWGKRQVAIPSGAIERLQNDEVTLSLSNGQVGALEALPG